MGIMWGLIITEKNPTTLVSDSAKKQAAVAPLTDPVLIKELEPIRRPEPVRRAAPAAAAAAAVAPPPTVRETKESRKSMEQRESRESRESREPIDFLQAISPVAKYRDTEHNLILNSKDRDWLRQGSGQNRYNFSVILDSNRPQQTSQQLTLMNRFRNIIRIEFVKAILPVESLSKVIPRLPAEQHAFFSVLAFPYITILLDEYQGNNYGTNDAIDRSFAICQFDGNWQSTYETTATPNTNHGFSLFYPKFMRAQRIYEPTPLSSFQRLQFTVLDSQDQQLSVTPDCSLLQRLAWSFDVSGSAFSDSSGSYLFIQTREYFPVWSYSQLDKVIFDGLTFTSTTPVIAAAGKQVIQWLQNPEGTVVLGTAYTMATDSSGTAFVSDGANAAGYANWIIIQNRFVSPILGGVGLQYFVPAIHNDTALAAEFFRYPSHFQGGGVLNLSRQVQLVLRVVTRDYDSASNIRPDNI
jgi:hypothetical protein